MATISLQSNLSELDAMLHDLHSSSYRGDDYSDYCCGQSASAMGDEVSGAPMRPPPPIDDGSIMSRRSRTTLDTGTLERLPRATKPPKLQHVLSNHQHDLVKALPRDDDTMKAPDFESDDDYYYGGDNSDYSKVAESIIPSDEELEKVDAGETPRGDKSMVIKTDYGELKSKYRYKGFGLWENTEPADPPPPPKKPSPPPPPPKAEPIWYNCTVSVKKHASSKELDDLVQGLDGYERMPSRNVEIGNAGADCPAGIGDIYEEFEKEDMSEMFRRALLEKMALVDDSRQKKYRCVVCSDWIHGRIITAMSKKFHPKCFCCTYCTREFKERSFKSDQEGKPYCYECFEKLLGHFGSAHFKLKELP